jgi:outer membrane protein assembly factor BamB
LAESWSYNYSFDGGPPDYPHGTQEFSGLADSEGNLYWALCIESGRVFLTISCSLRSTDWDGNERFQVDLGGGPGALTTVGVHLVAGSVLVTELSAILSGRSTFDGSVLWTRDLRDEFPTIYRALGSIAHDGQGRIFLTAGAAVLALSADTGETIWRYDEGSAGRLILDESGNVYFPDRTFITSLDRDGGLRFQREVPGRLITVAHGRLLIASEQWQVSDLLDADTGATIAELSGTPLDGMALLSRDLGFFIQRSADQRSALVAFDLAGGGIQWRFPLGDQSAYGQLLTDEGNVLLLDKWELLEISPQGQVLRANRLRPSDRIWGTPAPFFGFGPILLGGRWIAQFGATVFAYDLPGAPGEGRLGWNSRYGDAQHENRPREK